jgi:hypothetical protein
LVIVSLVRQIILDNYEGAYFCILTIVLLYVPSWVQVRLRIELPPPLEITILCFICAAEILGRGQRLLCQRASLGHHAPHYQRLFGGSGRLFSRCCCYNDNEKLTFDLSPFFLAMVAYCLFHDHTAFCGNIFE